MMKSILIEVENIKQTQREQIHLISKLHSVVYYFQKMYVLVIEYVVFNYNI